MPAPRTLLAATVALLILGGASYRLWQIHGYVDGIRRARDARHAQLQELERRATANTSPATDPAARTRPAAAQAAQLALDLLAANLEIRTAQAQGRDLTQEMMDRYMRLQCQADLLDAEGLKTFIAGLVQNSAADDVSVLRLIKNALSMLADRNPEAALTLVLRPDSGLSYRTADGVIASALGTWALRSPDKAAVWLDARMGSDASFLSGSLIQALTAQLIAAEPSALVTLLQDHVRPVVLMSSLLNNSFDPGSEGQTRSLAAAKDYLDTLPPGEARELAVPIYYRALSTTISRGQFQQLSGSLAGENLDAAALGGLLNGLCSRPLDDDDLPRWADWVLGQAPSSQLGNSFGPAITGWAMQNPTQIVAWALATPDTEARNAALDRVALATTRMNPAESERIAEMLPAGGPKTLILRRTYDQWPAGDPDGKAGFAARHGLK